MSESTGRAPGGRQIITAQRGVEVLNDPAINKGTAFTDAERDALGLHGLLPPRIEDLGDQLVRIRGKYDALHDDLERHIFLRALQDTNEVLFYAFVSANLEELMPIVYTPTVGAACQQFSQIYRRPHGLFLSYTDRHRLDELLASVQHEVRVIVVTDGQRILGLGDQGLGGMGIPIGKLSLYTAIGGIDPDWTLPILLDVGTDNPELLDDPLYLGWRSPRVTGEEYDRFVDDVVEAIIRHFPEALLQWEDFASTNAPGLLERYRHRLLSFNDDIQGTAAVGLAAILAGLGVTDTPLGEAPVLIVGAGSAGTGIAEMLIETLAQQTGHDRHQVFLVDREGLLHDGRDDLADYQRPFAQRIDDPDLAATTDLTAMVEAIRPAVLIGVSGQPGLFTQPVIEAVAAAVERPVVMPLSNPTSRAEATPADILAWSDGRALVATGSPFADVNIHGRSIEISQANNVYVFPGLGLGALAAGASQITDAMLAAAAGAVAERPLGSDGAPVSNPDEGLLPDIVDIRAVSRRIALAVAQTAVTEGVAPTPELDGGRTLGEELTARIDELWWEPIYPDFGASAEL